MKRCSSCHRHVHAEAEACPFCGASCPMTRPDPRWGVILGAALWGCGPAVADPGGGGTGSETSTGEVTSGSSSSTASTDTGESSSSGSTSTGFDTGSSDDSGAGSVGFYGGPAPDHPPAIECDVWAQDCPDGEKCMPWANDGTESWNALRCVPLFDDPDQPGEACTVEGSGVSGIDSCALGSMCFFVDPTTNEGTCVEMCGGTPGNPLCDDTDDACLIANEGVLALCLPTCDPLLQSCAVGQVCVPGAAEFVCMTARQDPAGDGEPCDGLNACDAGLLCVEDSCTAYCDATEIDPCEGDLVCAAVIGEVGACVEG